MAVPKSASGEYVDSKLVPFNKLFLDPNNPRIAPEDAPGYEDPRAIFDDELQAKLEKRVHEVYSVANLEASIMAQGWVPYDPIIVWEHPKKRGHFIVVEGNTRTVALRALRGQGLERERKKLEKLQKSPNRFAEDLKVQQQTVKHLEDVVAATNQIRVYTVDADSGEELLEKLPRLLGVRHITHAQPWSPYATNLYILSLYERLFRARLGAKPALRLEQDLVAEVAKLVSLGETKTRRNIQAASAFTHFKREYEDQLPEGEEFTDNDHYFFELILQNKYPQEQFGFTKDALRLPSESEEALFKWAFSQPRKDKGEENKNIFYKAENIRLWNQLHSYDGDSGTSFATQLDVDEPDAAKPMRLIEADFLQHKTRRSPIEALASLLKTLQELKVDALVSQQEHLEPMLDEVSKLVETYRRMMKAAAAA